MPNSEKPIMPTEIVLSDEDRSIFEQIVEIVQFRHNGITPIQIRNFVLNDVEFPTAWGKFDQAKAELTGRYNEIVHLAFEIMKGRLQAQLKEEEASNEAHPIKKQIIMLDRDEILLREQSCHSRLKALIREAVVFLDVYKKYKHFDELPAEEVFKLEMEQWAKKARNMPMTFEERYGDKFMQEALGEDYEAYKALRKKYFGFFPREIVSGALGEHSSDDPAKLLGMGNNWPAKED